MRTRKEIEELEFQNLAPYAMKSGESEGREHNEPDHPTRTAYQRDRDRIIHSEAFRKLEYKTQVFVIFEGDYYRTRLTHTLEVAQIARSIGRNLRLNEDLIEAISLSHDLGHPPFGHAGEEALRNIMEKEGFKTFNHNWRSFEIVTKFEKRYPNFNGLNLTREVRVGILKHKTAYDVPEMELMRKEYPEGPTLEAQVVDIADSLAYLNHDIDDGITSGCLHEDDFMDSRLWRQVRKKIQEASQIDHPEIIKYQIVKELIDRQVQDLLSHSDKILKEVNPPSAAEIKKMKKNLVGFSEDMAAQRDELQRLVHEKFYRHPRILRMTSKAKRIVGDIFQVYANDPHQLPYEVYDRRRNYTKKDKYETICSYMADMSDKFALDEHKKLFNPYEKV